MLIKKAFTLATLVASVLFLIGLALPTFGRMDSTPVAYRAEVGCYDSFSTIMHRDPGDTECANPMKATALGDLGKVDLLVLLIMWAATIALQLAVRDDEPDGDEEDEETPA